MSPLEIILAVLLCAVGIAVPIMWKSWSERNRLRKIKGEFIAYLYKTILTIGWNPRNNTLWDTLVKIRELKFVTEEMEHDFQALCNIIEILRQENKAYRESDLVMLLVDGELERLRRNLLPLMCKNKLAKRHFKDLPLTTTTPLAPSRVIALPWKDVAAEKAVEKLKSNIDAQAEKLK